MEIILAKNAGFCFGVQRAYDRAYNELKNGRLYTYGSIIHNKQVVGELAYLGAVTVNDVSEIDSSSNIKKIVIRAQGVTEKEYNSIKETGIDVLDCTCPCVKKIHHIVSEENAKGGKVIIVGDPKHSEVVGINGWADNSCVIINTAEDALLLNVEYYKNVTIVQQTTFERDLYRKIKNILIEKGINLQEFDTICDATKKRQEEAAEIAKRVDKMIVIGDKNSANTNNLYKICKKNCKNAYLYETMSDLVLNIFDSNDKIGITAGASTPAAIIKEVVEKMSELDMQNPTQNQTFEQMLDETLVTLHKGDVVTGKVIQVSNEEVSVNLGYKSDGVIEKGEFSSDPSVLPSTIVKPGDDIEVFVIHVNDGDGNVLLSRRKVEAQKGMLKIEEAFENKEPVTGKVVDIVKGGIIVLVNDIRVFVPSSQVSNKYISDLTPLKGKELRIVIIELDKAKKRIVGGRRELAAKEYEEAKQKIFTTLKPSDMVKGVVSRLTDFGAFVDLGGIDGLIHVSELSWGVVSNPKQVLQEGQEVMAKVLSVDSEKGKVSLSLKNEENDPWNLVSSKYAIGDLVTGQVVRMVPFGAFVELQEGITGLIHVSQISAKHVAKPEDELKKGQEVTVKIIDIDLEKRKISLSKKEAEGVLTTEEAINETSETTKVEE